MAWDKCRLPQALNNASRQALLAHRCAGREKQRPLLWHTVRGLDGSAPPSGAARANARQRGQLYSSLWVSIILFDEQTTGP